MNFIEAMRVGGAIKRSGNKEWVRAEYFLVCCGNQAQMMCCPCTKPHLRKEDILADDWEALDGPKSVVQIHGLGYMYNDPLNENHGAIRKLVKRFATHEEQLNHVIKSMHVMRKNFEKIVSEQKKQLREKEDVQRILQKTITRFRATIYKALNDAEEFEYGSPRNRIQK